MKGFWKKAPWISALIIIICAIIVVWVLKAPIMSAYLSSKLKVDVSISRVGITPSRLNIKGLRIKNSGHFHRSTAFSAKKIAVNYRWGKLFGTPTVIDSIIMEDMFLNIDCENPFCSKNNWTDIATRLKEKKSKDKKKSEVLIKKLILRNLTVQTKGLGLFIKPKPIRKIPEIVLTNINSKDGFPTDQLIAQIFKGANLMDYIQNILSPSGIWQDILSPFKNLGSENGEVFIEDETREFSFEAISYPIEE